MHPEDEDEVRLKPNPASKLEDRKNVMIHVYGKWAKELGRREQDYFGGLSIGIPAFDPDKLSYYELIRIVRSAVLELEDVDFTMNWLFNRFLCEICHDHDASGWWEGAVVDEEGYIHVFIEFPEGINIEPQPEPIQVLPPYDFLPDEVIPEAFNGTSEVNVEPVKKPKRRRMMAKKSKRCDPKVLPEEELDEINEYFEDEEEIRRRKHAHKDGQQSEPHVQLQSTKSRSMPRSKVCPSFIAPYLPLTHSQNLLIPTFVVELIKVIPERVILKDPIGRSWQVGVSKTHSGVYFMDGWENFIKENSVECGELLNFKYKSDNSFKFYIYERSGCMRKYEEEENCDNFEDDDDEDGGIENADDADADADDAGDDDADYDYDYDYDCDDDADDADYDCDDDAGGDDADYDDDDADADDACASSGQQTAKRLKKFKSKFPHFKIRLTAATTCYQTRIPSKFAKENLALCLTKIKIKLNGKSWQVNCGYNSHNGHYFFGGWRHFIQENNLKKDDVCFFELKKENKLYLTLFRSAV